MVAEQCLMASGTKKTLFFGLFLGIWRDDQKLPGLPVIKMVPQEMLPGYSLSMLEKQPRHLCFVMEHPLQRTAVVLIVLYISCRQTCEIHIVRSRGVSSVLRLLPHLCSTVFPYFHMCSSLHSAILPLKSLPAAKRLRFVPDEMST